MSARVAHQFDDADQQHHAAELGMWTFLTTEVLFFGGLFTAYTMYRARFPHEFAEASHHLSMWIGAVNTAVLLVSSFFMALAVSAAGSGRGRRAVIVPLLATAGLGCVFLALKAVEYGVDLREGIVPGPLWDPPADAGPHAELFMVIYFVMTGLHALHMIAGIGAVAIVTAIVIRAEEPRCHASGVEMTGLYWHFVDIVWIFLFPLLYVL